MLSRVSAREKPPPLATCSLADSFHSRPAMVRFGSSLKLGRYYDRIKSRLSGRPVLTTIAQVAKSQAHIRNKTAFSSSVKSAGALRNRKMLIGLSRLRTRHRSAGLVRRDAE